MQLIIWLSVIIVLLLNVVLAMFLIVYRQNQDLCNKAIVSIRTVGLIKTLKKIQHYRILRNHTIKEVDRSSWIEYDDAVSIAVFLCGGFGDYIISAKVVEELQDLANCRIEIFGEKHEFIKAIYGENSTITFNFKDEFLQQASRYDLAILIDHFIECFNYRRDKVIKISEELAKKIDYLVKHYKELYVDIKQQCYRERIHFEKCKLEGLDRWTELRMGKTFDINEKKVRIPMLNEYKSCLDKFGLNNKKYITINYGTDAIRVGMKQLKLWPKDNLETFVRLFHDKYADIYIVQLGAQNAEKVAGADFYIFGEKIEATKWILKQSLLHIDCEGGLVHLATQLDTKCVVLFGPTPVHMYGYKQNINIHNDECEYCMGLSEDWAYKCFKGYSECNCLRNITPELVINTIDKRKLI